MNTAMKIRPRAFKAGPLVTLDMRLDRGFMSGVLVQDRSLAANHGTAAGGSNLPIPQYPGFLFDQSDNQSIGASDVLTGNVYPYTFAAWVKYSGADAERCILSLGEAASVHHCTLKTYTNEYGCTGRDKDAGMPDTGSCLTSGGAIEADVWKCLTVVCPADGPDGVSVDWSVYLNGVEDSNVQTGRTFDFALYCDNWKIGDGADSTPNGNPWNGVIGEVVFERRSWSAAEAKGYFERTKRFYGV